MKRLYLFLSTLIGIAISFIPSIAFAANHNLPQIFNPGEDDLSVKFLSQVFGSVGSVLHGTGSQLLGHIFKVINTGLLILAGGIIAYTVIIGLINTASDGEIMGKKLNSFWVVTRTVLGIGALVPTASGYSAIQIIVMWVVIQSIGLANFAWETALNYLGEEGGVVFATTNNSTLNKDGARKSLESATKILISQTCVAMINAKNQQNQSIVTAEYRKDPTNPILRTMATSSDNAGIRYNTIEQTASFGTKDSPDICGKYNLNPSSIAGKTGRINEADTGFKQIVINLQPVAKKIAEFKFDPNDPTGNKNRLDQLKNITKMALVGATVDYENILSGAKRRSIEAANQQWKEDIKTAQNEGWITAGSYYRKLGEANNNLQNQATDYQAKIISHPNAGELSSIIDTEQYKSNIELVAIAGKGAEPELIAALDRNSNNGVPPINKKTADTIIGSSAAAFIGGTFLANMFVPAMIPAASSITVLTVSLLPATYIWIDKVNQPGDPIMKLQAVGTAMTATGVALWLALTTTITLLGMAGSVLHGILGVGLAISHSLQPLMPVLTAVVTILFVTGLTLAVYVPMIPFIVFTFAAIGWIIFVLEAMAAGPLVALGVTHPEGHDLLGKSEQALMLLLSVFLRPVMMILGLFSAIIVSQVALNILNAGLDRIITSTGVINSGVFLFGILAVMIIYTMVVISIINMSSNLIILIDQKVKAWIGLHPDHSTFDHQLQEIKGGLTSASQSAANSGMQKLGTEAQTAHKDILEAKDKGKDQVGGAQNPGDGNQPAPGGGGQPPANN